jgi:hypothetical protein
MTLDGDPDHVPFKPLWSNVLIYLLNPIRRKN